MAERIPIVGRNDESEPIDLTAYVRQKPFSRFGALALDGIVLVSIFMNFYKLGQGGFGNSYYAAGVRSMLDNWRNFFFVSYDPGGFVSIDKPPVGFWLQVASSTLFGFTPFNVFLPQALAGVLAVILLYHLVHSHFGVTAGLFAALALAVSPISVVTNRNNTIDSTLALVLLLGAWAVLFGIGIVTTWRDFRRGSWRGWLLPLALVATGAEQVLLLRAYPAWGRWLIPLIVGLGVVGLVGLGMTRLSARLSLSRWAKQLGAVAVSVAVLSLMVAPTVWAAIPVVQGQASQLPEAGPSQLRDFGGPRGGNVDASLISYLEANRGNATFLVAVPSSMSADSLILSTNQPVMALGGFMGSDPILTTNGLASLVKQGTVRFFLISVGRFGGPGGFGRGNQSAVTSWVTQSCKVVPSSAWQSAASNLGGRFGFGGANQLYDCGAK